MPTPSNSRTTKKSTTPRKRPAPKLTEDERSAYDPGPATGTYGAGWGSPLRDVKMPSGTLAQLRRPGVPGLVAAGVIDNLDTLSNLVVDQHINRARGTRKLAKQNVDTAKLMANPQAMKDIGAVMEKIVCYVVNQPEVRPVPRDEKDLAIPEARRKELPSGVIWYDWVTPEDAVFILNYAVGGTADLAQFREEFSELLGGVSEGQKLQL